MTTVHVLGIRHHGPGSARSVARALDEVRPTAVVIEGPPELDAIAELAGQPDMVPPVAALTYVPDEPRRAAFYPMAVFSPEWVALRWAHEAGVPVRFADLPAAHALAPEPDDPGDPGDSGREDRGVDGDRDPAALDELDGDIEVAEPADPDDEGRAARRDPIGALAGAAGYDDPERWWEDAVEQRAPGADAIERFDAVREAMAAVRATEEADEETLRREAAMRRVLREVIKQGHDDVVVVCGAYHAPVLHPDAFPAISADAARLKNLPKVKVATTWAPWTSGRLAARSGYGAGVHAPGWYQHLFTAPDDTIARWMVEVARALRAAQLDASPASVVEATRLADALAALRARPLAGLQEVTDAARSVLGHGSDVPLQIVHEQLVVGHLLGSVPADTPMVPLARDLERIQRKLRLKVSAEQTVVQVDLRQPSQLARSELFHRLLLLDVAWAVPADAGRTTGTFKEAWQLEWRPELAVDLVEAGLYGTTVVSAASARVAADAATSDDLTALSRLVEQCLLADLPDALTPVLAELAAGTAGHHDIRALLGAVEPLARTCRYGDVRGVDTARIDDVLEVLVVRAAIGLAPACGTLDDDAATEVRAAIEAADRGIALLERTELAEPWTRALTGLAVQHGVHGSVAGRVNRLLLDRGSLAAEEAGRRLARQLSVGGDPSHAAAWLDGFLAGEALLLLHDRELLAVIDAWVSDIDERTFDDLLPLVRRTFAAFEKPARRQIGELLVHTDQTGGGPAASNDDDPVDTARAAAAVATMARLLGISGEAVR